MPGGEQKTEKPTEKRKAEARREGRVARSTDVGSWVTLLALVGALPTLGARAVHEVTGLFSATTEKMSAADPNAALGLFATGLRSFLVAVLPLVGVIAAAGVFANVAQVGFRFAPGALSIKLSKINPKTGLQRMFSTTGLWDLTKALIRLVALISWGGLAAKALVSSLLAGGTLPLSSTLTLAGSGLIGIIRNVGAIALVLALGDYAFQRHKHRESMKMTREEFRREMKENELSPEVRRALRRRRRGLSRLQMIAAVADADVVVVNPTHYAVALAYDRLHDAAPRVVAKGDDEIALAIKAEARLRAVPVIEHPPIARSLFAACEVGEPVPVELYEVVAKVLAFVYRLSAASRSLVEVHHLAF